MERPSVRTYRGSDGLTHRIYIATPLRSHHSPHFLQCTRENLFHLPVDETDKVVTCLCCLTTKPPMLSE